MTNLRKQKGQEKNKEQQKTTQLVSEVRFQ